MGNSLYKYGLRHEDRQTNRHPTYNKSNIYIFIESLFKFLVNVSGKEISICDVLKEND